MERLAGRIMLLSGVRRAAVAFLAGAFGVLALAPFEFSAALFVSFPVLVWLLDGASGEADAGPVGRLRPAFATGWWFGFGYFVAGLWWVGAALLVEADSFAWALPIAVLGLPAMLAVFYGLACAFARLFWSDGVGRIAALAVGFGLAEWLRSFVLTGFPWNAIGYGAMPIPLMMQSAHVAGLLAINLLAVFVFAAPALIATGRGVRLALSLALILVVADIGYGLIVLRQAPALDAPARDAPVFRIVQPSIDQSERMTNADAEQVFRTYLKLTSAPPKTGGGDPKFIVWPETAAPFILTENPDALQRIAKTLKPGQTLLTGAVRVEEGQPGDPPRYYNAIDVINDKGEIVAAADKVHLVPFGEYMPFAWLLRRLGVSPVAMPGGFTAGTERRTLTLGSGVVALPLICYEIIFPGATDARGPAPDIILNVTNDAWYGRTTGPYQHLQQARLRAVELGLPLLRAANNGVSVAVDSYGRILAGIRLDGVGVIDARPGKPNTFKVSPGTRLLIFWILVAAFLIAAIISRKSLARERN